MAELLHEYVCGLLFLQTKQNQASEKKSTLEQTLIQRVVELGCVTREKSGQDSSR